MRVFTVLLGLLLAAMASPVLAQAPHHHLVIQVDSQNPVLMLEALHNASNVIETVRKGGGAVDIEIVANGPGSDMFANLSPVKQELRRFHEKYPDVVLSECAISFAHMAAKLHRKLTVLPEAHLVPSGAVRIMELEEQHWAYLKP